MKNLSKKTANEISRLVNTLAKSFSLPSNYAYIIHHATIYGNVPSWVTMNVLTFGQVSKMYQYLPSDIRTKISKHFGNLTEMQLHQMITLVARCRNICAHSERLYSFKIRENIPDMPLHSKLKIPKKNGQFIYGKNDLFAVVIALRYLIGNEEFKKFKHSLLQLINHANKNCPHISKNQLLANMGFPQNWDRILRFKK